MTRARLSLFFLFVQLRSCGRTSQPFSSTTMAPATTAQSTSSRQAIPGPAIHPSPDAPPTASAPTPTHSLSPSSPRVVYPKRNGRKVYEGLRRWSFLVKGGSDEREGGPHIHWLGAMTRLCTRGANGRRPEGFRRCGSPSFLFPCFLLFSSGPRCCTSPRALFSRRPSLPTPRPAPFPAPSPSSSPKTTLS